MRRYAEPPSELLAMKTLNRNYLWKDAAEDLKRQFEMDADLLVQLLGAQRARTAAAVTA